MHCEYDPEDEEYIHFRLNLSDYDNSEEGELICLLHMKSSAQINIVADTENLEPLAPDYEEPSEADLAHAGVENPYTGLIDLASRQECLTELRGTHIELMESDDGTSTNNPVEDHIREYLSKYNLTDSQLDDFLVLLRHISREEIALLQTLPLTARTWRNRDHGKACLSDLHLENGGSNLIRKVRMIYCHLFDYQPHVSS